MAPAEKSGIATRSTLSPGYGMSKYSEKKRSEKAPISRAKSVRCPLPGGKTTASGTPSTSTVRVRSNGPTMNATRYVDIRIVGANCTSRVPSARGVSKATGEFEYAETPWGTTSETV